MTTIALVVFHLQLRRTTAKCCKSQNCILWIVSVVFYYILISGVEMLLRAEKIEQCNSKHRKFIMQLTISHDATRFIFQLN